MLRNLTRLGVRKFSTEMGNSHGSSETKIISKTTAEGVKTYITETVTYAKQTWSTMSPLARKLTYGYMGCMAIDNVYGTYQGGKEALEQFRYDQDHAKNLSKKQNSSYQIETFFEGVRTAETDWQATYYGCRRNMFSRFLGSTIWPVGIFSKIMPSMIMMLNPNPKDSVM